MNISDDDDDDKLVIARALAAQQTQATSVVSEQEPAVRTLLSLTTVDLPEGVKQADLGISLDNRVSLLVDRLEKKTGKYISVDEEAIDVNTLSTIIENKKKEMNLPNLENPQEEDLQKIREHFPGLTDEQIAENYDAICMVYQDELSALIFDSVVANCTAKGSDKAPDVTDPNLQTRGLGHKIKNWFHHSSHSAYNFGVFVQNSASNAASTVASKTNNFLNEVQDKLKEITISELAVCLKHPFSAPSALAAYILAYKLTDQYMGNCEETSTKVDAFRHSIMIVALAEGGFGTKKQKMQGAESMGYAHEKKPGNNGNALIMDLHNNQAGLVYYANAAKEQYVPFTKIEILPKEPYIHDACAHLKNLAISAVYIDDNLGVSEFLRASNSVSLDKLIYKKVSSKWG